MVMGRAGVTTTGVGGEGRERGPEGEEVGELKEGGTGRAGLPIRAKRGKA